MQVFDYMEKAKIDCMSHGMFVAFYSCAFIVLELVGKFFLF